MTNIRGLAALLLAMLFVAQESSAQTPARDPSTRIREVLPPQIAQQVLDRIADARARQLPAEALENRVLKFAAKGVDPVAIERSVAEQADRMGKARAALESGRRSRASGDEIEAGAEAMRKGVDGAAVSRLARSAPPQRSLAVALFVVGSLAERGLSVNDALSRVLERIQAQASDADLESLAGQLPAQAAGGQARRGGAAAQGVGNRPTKAGKPASAGPPPGVPANAGAGAKKGRKPPR